jgi:hypothetical protein
MVELIEIRDKNKKIDLGILPIFSKLTLGIFSGIIHLINLKKKLHIFRSFSKTYSVLDLIGF